MNLADEVNRTGELVKQLSETLTYPDASAIHQAVIGYIQRSRSVCRSRMIRSIDEARRIGNHEEVKYILATMAKDREHFDGVLYRLQLIGPINVQPAREPAGEEVEA